MRDRSTSFGVMPSSRSSMLILPEYFIKFKSASNRDVFPLENSYYQLSYSHVSIVILPSCATCDDYLLSWSHLECGIAKGSVGVVAIYSVACISTGPISDEDKPGNQLVSRFDTVEIYLAIAWPIFGQLRSRLARRFHWCLVDEISHACHPP